MIKKESRFPSESGSPFRSLQADLRAGEGVVLVRVRLAFWPER